MGAWENGGTFLIVLGDSREDCLDRLETALEDYSEDDVEQITSMWYERWEGGPGPKTGWIHEGDVPRRSRGRIRASVEV